MLSYSDDKIYDAMLRQIGYGTIKRLLELESGVINDFVLNTVRKIITGFSESSFSGNNSLNGVVLHCESHRNGELLTSDYTNVGKIYLDFVVSPDKSFKEIVDYCDWEEDPSFYKIKVVEQNFMVAVTKVIYLVIKKELIHLS